MGKLETLPLWIADTWVESLSATDGPTAQVKKQLEVAEALMEHLAAAFLCTLFAERTLVSPRARERIAAAAVRCFAKRSAFGDWVSFVDAATRAGPALLRRVLGVDELPPCPLGSPLVGVFAGIMPGPPGEMTFIRFFEQIVQFRNLYSHTRTEASEAEVLAPRLTRAFEHVFATLPGITARPLCHVARAASEATGFVVVFRHLCGSGRLPDARHAVTDHAQTTAWRGNLLAFWDGAESTPTPVPEWLARYDRSTHSLSMCQGTDADKRSVIFHTRQLNGATTNSTQAYDQLWSDLAAIGVTKAPAALVPAQTPPGETIYVDAYRRALANDGVVTPDERAILDGIAEGFGFSSERRAALERSIVSPKPSREVPVVTTAPPTSQRPETPEAPEKRRSSKTIAVAAVLVVAVAAALVVWNLGGRRLGATASDAGPAPGMVWRRLPAGTFTFGAGAMARSITLRAFDLGETEVTNAQYAACEAAGVCMPPHHDDGTCQMRENGVVQYTNTPEALRAPNKPVMCVTPSQARVFAEWAKGRLPSEAEWEYAARDAGRYRVAPWGDTPADCTRARVGSTDKGPGCGDLGPHDALTGHPQGSFGLRDVIGNVFEIVADAYDPAGPPADGTPRDADSTGREVVIRGGGWRPMPGYDNATARGRMKPTDASHNIGFRIARDAEP
jgi:formylglycine-generating enzyme required for sulfatase activity